MADTTVDRNTQSRPVGVVGQGVAASSIILLGVLCCIDADGFAVEGEDTAGLKFAGVSREAKDNSSGADGDETIELYTEGDFRFASSGLSADDVGCDLYLVDNQTVGKADDPDNHVYVGKMVEFISATEVWVRIEPLGSKLQQFTIEAPGTNAAAVDVSGQASDYGGSDFHIASVQHVDSFVTSGGASAGRKIETTNWTLASGVLTTVTDESANTLVITFLGYVLP